MGKTKDLLPQENWENELAHFNGSENFQKLGPLFRNWVLTEGALYVAETAGAYWLMDKIAATIMHEPVMRRLEDRSFFHVTLTVLPAQEKNARIVFDDGNNNILFEESFWTDFPYTGIEFYVEFDGTYYTIMLKTEH